MARRRPWRCHREIERPYTRVSKRKKFNFVPGAPQPRLRRMLTGNLRKQPKEWKYVGHLISLDAVQISDYALEALRNSLNRAFDKIKEDRLIVVRAFPHHVVREHSIAYGAGADRISQGMRLAFGKPVMRAAQIFPGKIVVSVYFDNPKLKDKVYDLLRIARCKLSGKYKIVVGENSLELINNS